MTFKQLYPRDKATFKQRERLQPGRHQHTQNIVVFLSLDGTILTDTTSFSGVGVLPTMAFTGKLRPKAVPFSGFKYMKGWGFPVEDPGEGPGARPPPPPLFLDQNEARRAEKRFLGDRPPLISRSGSGTDFTS